MAKKIALAVQDAALVALQAADRLVALAAEPADYAAADAGALASAALQPGDFSVAAGAAGARVLTVAAKDGVPVEGDGTATHVALLDDVGEALLYVTTCADEPVAVPGEVDFSGFTVTAGALS